MSSTNAAPLGPPTLLSVENQVKSLIAATEAKIERLTGQIRELSLLREKERSTLATLRLMVVPIGKLPTELLVEIFKRVLPNLQGPAYHSRWTAHAALRSLLCLSQVSPYWRQIVHNTPQLWARSFIEIFVDRDSEVGYLDGLEPLLARSNSLPVSIALVQSAKNPSYAVSSKTLARIVTPTAHRWKTLSIEMPSFSSFDILPPGTFEALEHLSITGFETQMDPVVVFQSSPRLLNFTFVSNSEVSKIHLLRIPWSQIAHLHIDDTSMSQACAVLLQCNQLISATFAGSNSWESAFPVGGSAVVTLLFLNQLALTFREPEPDTNAVHSVEAFLEPLALPALQKLSVDFGGDPAEYWPTQAFALFQGRCPNIEEIALYDNSISSQALITLLRNGPALVTLKVISCWECIDEHFWDAFRYDVADPRPLVPKLRNLHLECVGNKFTDDSMEAALRSRWWPDGGVSGGPPPRISPLKNVLASRFDDDSDNEGRLFSEQFKAQMQDMVQQGLNLDLWGWH